MEDGEMSLSDEGAAPSAGAVASRASVRRLRFGLQLKLIAAFAMIMLAIYALVPYLMIRFEQDHLLVLLRTGKPPPTAEYILGRVAKAGSQAVLVASVINALLLVVGVLFLRSAIRPLKSIAQGLEGLAAGRHVEPVHLDTGDEISDLADAYNALNTELRRYRGEMAQREQILEERVHQRTGELARQKRFVEGIVETADVGILTVSADRMVTSWNTALEKLTGRKRENSIGRSFGDSLPMDQKEVLARELGEVIAAGSPVVHREFESTVWRKPDLPGEWICCDISMVPLRDAADRIDGALVTISDVTKRKELHMQLSQSTKLAAVGELAGGVAHEINNPLAIILGNAELLIDDMGENSELGKQAVTIKRHALRCKEIVANLLKFAGRTQHGTGPINLGQLLADTLTLLRKQLELDNIEIVERLGVIPGTIMGSADELQQVFFSLISNARDAMPKGGTLTVETLTVGHHVEVQICDTGVGIPKENLDRIFSPFFTTKDPGKGTGLGLAIAHTIANSHGGNISVISELGEGTRVTVRLPLVATEGSERPEEARPAVEKPVVAETRHLKILLVDDESGIRMVCREALERLKHEVVECRDGEEALAKLGEEQFDLVLLDLKMPRVNGAETLVRMRERNIPTPALIMTGLIDEEMLGTVPKGAFHGILKKPFQMSELKGWVQKIFSQDGAAEK